MKNWITISTIFVILVVIFLLLASRSKVNLQNAMQQQSVPPPTPSPQQSDPSIDLASFLTKKYTCKMANTSVPNPNNPSTNVDIRTMTIEPDENNPVPKQENQFRLFSFYASPTAAPGLEPFILQTTKYGNSQPPLYSSHIFKEGYRTDSLMRKDVANTVMREKIWMSDKPVEGFSRFMSSTFQNPPPSMKEPRLDSITVLSKTKTVENFERPLPGYDPPFYFYTKE